VWAVGGFGSPKGKEKGPGFFSGKKLQNQQQARGNMGFWDEISLSCEARRKQRKTIFWGSQKEKKRWAAERWPAKDPEEKDV